MLRVCQYCSDAFGCTIVVDTEVVKFECKKDCPIPEYIDCAMKALEETETYGVCTSCLEKGTHNDFTEAQV